MSKTFFFKYMTHTLVPYNDILKLASDIEQKQTTFIVLFCVAFFVCFFCFCFCFGGVYVCVIFLILGIVNFLSKFLISKMRKLK